MPGTVQPPGHSKEKSRAVPAPPEPRGGDSDSRSPSVSLHTMRSGGDVLFPPHCQRLKDKAVSVSCLQPVAAGTQWTLSERQLGD